MVKHSNGFTLLELIIILGILGLTMAIAAPNLGVMIKNNRISSDVNDFVAALQFAKAEAAARISPVTICKRNTTASDCVGGGDWSQGWIVFADANADGTVDADDEVLMAHDALDSRTTFGGTSGVATSITYQPQGTTSVTSTEVLVMCDERGLVDDASRAVLVTITGRGSVMKVSDTGQTTCL